MKVSIIVPVYNSERYLKQCLDSLIKQTLQDIEILAIDDNSTDRSLQILKNYQNKYPNKIKVIHNILNIGSSATRNIGIQISKGEYIGFVDSDDYVNYSMYQTMYEGAVKNNYPEVVITGINFVKDDYYLEQNFSFLKRTEGYVFNVLDNPNFILMQSPSVCNKLFRKDIIKDKKFLEGRMWEDVAFSFSKMFNANKILYYNNNDYFYRKRIDSGVSSKNYNINKNLLDIFDVADQIEKDTRESNRFKVFEKQIRFIQVITCLQRITEIMDWPISENDKNHLCQIMSNMVIKKYADWRKFPIEELSSRVGFFQLEKLKNLTINDTKLNSIDLENKLIAELNIIKNK